jgi:hypothetical protein
MLSRRERRFADREAEKILARMKRENKQVIDSQPKFIQPIKLTDEMVEEYKQYKDELRMQETTGNSEPTTNTGTNTGEVDNYFDNLDDYHFNK